MKTPLPQIGEGRVLADQVAVSLREAILNGYFMPGEKLDQDLIAEALEVSRTPVREAIVRLTSDGFIEMRPHHGAFIVQVSPRDVQAVYEVRKLLEVAVIRQVTSLIPNSVLDELEDSIAKTQRQFEAGDFSRRFENDVHFHEKLLGFAENRVLKEVLDDLANRISLIRRFAQLHPEPHPVSCLDEHRAILQAVRQRDPKRAAELMEVHLEKASLRIQKLAQSKRNWDNVSEQAAM